MGKIHQDQQGENAPPVGGSLGLCRKHSIRRRQGSRTSRVQGNQQRKSKENCPEDRPDAERQRYPVQEGKNQSQGETELHQEQLRKKS